MANIIAGILIVLSSFLLGGAMAGLYVGRIKFLTEFLDFIAFAEGEIEFYKREMKPLTVKFTEGKQTEFCKFLLSTNCEVGEGKETVEFKVGTERINTEATEEVKVKQLPDIDKMLVIEYLEGMANLDRNSQKGFSALLTGKVKKQLASAEQDSKIKGSLIKKLFPLVGVALFIIII